ncbi:hypothetical protein [Polluticoccus soli]|uniref:hypothetical protein n=1 Tax=Polluticoccus soli TaxID=3034150 RepID=UPI0023E13691|nr:hypothetical protein [Flavipsychrobacter sp. JY13-12]
MFLHFFFLLVYFIVSLFSSEVAASIVLSTHAVATLIERHIMRKVKIDPMTCYAFYSFLVGIANLIMIAAEKAGTLPAGYSYLIPANILQGISIFFVGNTFIFMGFELFSKKSFPKIDVLIESPANHSKLFILMLIFSARNLLFSDIMLGSLTGILTVFSSVGIIFFSRLWSKTDIGKYGTYAGILCVLQTAYALLFSYLRMELLTPAVCFTFGFFLGKGTIKAVFSYRAIPILIALFVFNIYFAWLGKNRSTYGEIKGVERLQQMVTLSKVETVYLEDDESQESILHRASVLPQITNVVELVKTKGHFNGDATAPLFIALVPRFLWPDKPLIGLGAWFATEIGQGNQTDSWYTNSINMTIQGQLFLDFGWTGIVAGCLFVGALLALIWSATGFYRSPFNLTGVTLGGFLFLSCMQGIGADLQFIVTLISYYLIFVVFKRFA